MDSCVEQFIGGDELLELIRERLAAGQKIRYLPFRGVSMMPMLRQGKDKVELSPLPQRLKPHDLPVYQYPSGKVVMHRIVRVEADHYICRGDNTYADERITQDMLIGVVSAFLRGDRRVEVTDPVYRLYARVWVAIYPVRKPMVRLKQKLFAFLRKLGFRRFWR